MKKSVLWQLPPTNLTQYSLPKKKEGKKLQYDYLKSQLYIFSKINVRPYKMTVFEK